MKTKKTKQEISKNSQGIQAQGNITIDNSGVKGEALLPVLMGIGNELGTVKTLISEVREYQRNKNYQVHIETIRNEIDNDVQYNNSHPKESTNSVKKTELIEQWMDEVSNIDPSEGVLSEIWHQWMVALAKGHNITDLSLLLELMKKITPIQGQLLLQIKKQKEYVLKTTNRTSMQLSHLKELEKLGVIETNRQISSFGGALVLTTILLTGLIFVLLNRVIDMMDVSTISVFGASSAFTLSLIGAILFAVMFISSFIRLEKRSSRFIVTYYRLTESGEKIVSFAKSSDRIDQ